MCAEPGEADAALRPSPYRSRDPPRRTWGEGLESQRQGQGRQTPALRGNPRGRGRMCDRGPPAHPAFQHRHEERPPLHHAQGRDDPRRSDRNGLRRVAMDHLARSAAGREVLAPALRWCPRGDRNGARRRPDSSAPAPNRPPVLAHRSGLAPPSSPRVEAGPDRDGESPDRGVRQGIAASPAGP